MRGEVLLWIVSGVCEDPRIHPSANTICAVENDTMSVRLNELVIQHELPGLVEELAPAMCQQLVARALAGDRAYKVLDGVRKLKRFQDGLQ